MKFAQLFSSNENKLLTPQICIAVLSCLDLKVHKNENFFGFDFEFFTVSLPVMHKYEGFVTNFVDWAAMGGR
jgi:hypothetical protein